MCAWGWVGWGWGDVEGSVRMWVCMCLYLYLCFCVCVYLYICECFCICVCVPLIYQICSFHKMIFNPFLHVVKIGNCITHYLRIIAIIVYVRCGNVCVCVVVVVVGGGGAHPEVMVIVMIVGPSYRCWFHACYTTHTQAVPRSPETSIYI